MPLLSANATGSSPGSSARLARPLSVAVQVSQPGHALALEAATDTVCGSVSRMSRAVAALVLVAFLGLASAARVIEPATLAAHPGRYAKPSVFAVTLSGQEKYEPLM